MKGDDGRIVLNQHEPECPVPGLRIRGVWLAKEAKAACICSRLRACEARVIARERRRARPPGHTGFCWCHACMRVDHLERA